MEWGESKKRPESLERQVGEFCKQEGWQKSWGRKKRYDMCRTTGLGQSFNCSKMMKTRLYMKLLKKKFCYVEDIRT